MSPRRWRAALAGTAVLAGVLPAVASAYAPPLTCRDVTTTLGWQRVPVEQFQPIEGVTSNDRVTAYSLSPVAPQRVVATNGKRLKVSSSNGCAWDDGLTLGLQPSGNVPLSGTTSTIVSTAILPSGRVLAAVREGAGAASRPHVLGSDSGRTGYQAHDNGLPPQGAPRFLEAADDGRTVYLVLAPSSGAGDPDSPLPGVPDVTSPTSGAKTGLLYASTDAGRSWTLRTSVEDLPAGGGGLDRLAVDRQNPNRLYAISNGLLLFSTNGGATFDRLRINNEDITAVETGPGGFVVAFSASGVAAVSSDGRNVFRVVRAPTGVTSAAYRGQSELAVEAGGQLSLLDVATGRVQGVPGVPAMPGSLIGSVGSQATFHGVSGHSLLRYSDPKPVNPPVDPPSAVGDIGVTPPPPGTITPAARTVQLKVGDSTVVDYSLALPKSPTPLDLFFLVDTSDSMNSLISDLKANIGKATQTIQRAGIDLQVGLGTVGVGPEQGKGTPPTLTTATGTGPKLYELLRPIGPVRGFENALARVDTKSGGADGSEEAQNIGLEQATAGMGVRDPSAPPGVELYLVPPGQDAGWRPAPDIRRLIVHASDEGFSRPAGTRLKDGEPDTQYTIDLMNKYRVQQVGLSLQVPDAQADLEQVARGTRTLAPPGGSDCGQDVVLPAGAPLVCDTTADFSAVLGPLVRSLVDRQRVTLTAKGAAPQVIRAIDASRLASVDVTVPNRLPFKVAVTCKGQSVGRYTENVEARLRGSRVASTRITVDCLGPAAAAARQIPPPIPPGAPAPAPVAQAPAGVVPAPPAAQPQLQPQSQPQVQSQVNPMSAAAMQQQEELQLALALQADDEKQGQAGTEMAMVSVRRQDESAALILLAAAMAASAGLGLARLRSRPSPSVARVRRDP